MRVWNNTKALATQFEESATACMRGGSVKDNAYDDRRFFQGYRRMREDPHSANELVEQPALKSCLPPLGGLEVLELGCGMGHLSLHLAEGGASRVLATDASERMLAAARTERAHERVEYRLCATEDLAFPPASFDLVASSLALHYVSDHAALVREVARWLRPCGRFVYSLEHPTKTAPKDPGKDYWARGRGGQRALLAFERLRRGGPRQEEWLAGSVVKHHRKLSSMLNDLVGAGMVIERVEEAEEVLAAGRKEAVFPRTATGPPC